MVDWISLLLGAVFVLWGTTVLAAGYVIWRYVYSPWKVMRADVKGLSDKFEELRAYVESEVGLRKAMVLTDAEEAAREQHARTRRAWASGPR